MVASPDDPDRDGAEEGMLDDDAPRREASVRLQVAGTTGGEAALREAMDPANQSLAEALRLSFRILQVAILGLLITFLFSGFQTVKEGYTGVKTIFGSIQGDGAEAQLAPGLEPFWPYPVGEIVVFESKRGIELRSEFWPRVPANTTVQRAIESADLSNPIRPGADGSVITADGDLAHLQLTAEYAIDDVSSFVSRVDRATADRIVRTALMRGVVIAAAVTPLGDLLADREPMQRRTDGGSNAAAGATGSTATSPAGSAPEPTPTPGAATPPATPPAADDTTASAPATASEDDAARITARSGRRSELEQLIREKAQQVLDQLDCGIRLVSVSVPERLAPLAVENRFAQAQVMREQSKEGLEKSRQEARARLVAAAGPAYAEILEGIRRYEVALLAGDDAQADLLLTTLGTRLERADIGGDAALIINRARAYQGAIQATLGAEARRVDGLAATFRDNPRQLVRQMWLDAIKQVFNDGRDQIEVFSVAPGISKFSINATSSPDVMQSRRDSEMARKKSEADAAMLLDPAWQLGLRGIKIDGPGRKLERDATRGTGR